MKSIKNQVLLRSRNGKDSGSQLMEQNSSITRRRNPRSHGERGHMVYRKRADGVDLSAEASELRRCRDLKLYTEHVKPVDYVDFNPDTNTLTTELIQGNQLFHTLWNPTYWIGRIRGHRMPNWDLLACRFEELGQWLRLYHDSTIQKQYKRHTGLDWLETAFLRKIEGVRLERSLPKPFVDAIEDHYLKQLSLSERHPARICQVHGDLIVYNLMLENGYRLRVLDFGDTRISSAHEDVARFYSGIWAMAQTNQVRNKQLLPLLERFLSGYGFESNELFSPLFRVNLAYNFVTLQYSLKSMRPMLSLNSWLELRQISQAGIRWIRQDISQGNKAY